MAEETKKRGRKTMTEEEKAAAAKLRAEKKAKEDNLRPAVIVQYQEVEVNTAELIEQAKAAFKAEKKRTRITDMQLYVKPEERAAYYVINETYTGKVEF